MRITKTQMTNFIEQLPWWALIKNVGYACVFFIGISPQSYFILAIFMVVDTLLGVVRVIIVHGGRAFRSYRLVSGIMAKLAIILIPVLIAYTGQGIGMDFHLLAVWTLNLLILAQAYSILGNIHSIYMRKDVYEFDAISWALTRIQNVIERILRQGAPDKTLEAIETRRDVTTQTGEEETVTK